MSYFGTLSPAWSCWSLFLISWLFSRVFGWGRSLPDSSMSSCASCRPSVTMISYGKTSLSSFTLPASRAVSHTCRETVGTSASQKCMAPAACCIILIRSAERVKSVVTSDMCAARDAPALPSFVKGGFLFRRLVTIEADNRFLVRVFVRVAKHLKGVPLDPDECFRG